MSLPSGKWKEYTRGSYSHIYSILSHDIALHCSRLRCTALNCALLHCIALHCYLLDCTGLHCTALCTNHISQSLFVQPHFSQQPFVHPPQAYNPPNQHTTPHQRHFPPWLGISSRITLGVQGNPSIHAGFWLCAFKY